MTELRQAENPLPFGPQRSPLARELARKSFHMLSLVYLGFYKLLGYPAVLTPMLVWTAVVIGVETWRLKSPAMNRALTRFFGGLARDDEHDKYSGIVHTTLGVLFIWLLYGGKDAIVAAGIYYVAFGDASAALVGKWIGRHKIGRSKKSVEGSAACFLACVLVGFLLKFPPPAVLAAAVTATVVEFLPTGRWWNDNLWMPVITATVLKLCAGY
jgi:dolichol kinase